MQVLEELYGQSVVWYREGHSVSAFHLIEEYLGIKTTQFGFGSPDYADQAMDGGSFRNDEKYAVAVSCKVLLTERLSSPSYRASASRWFIMNCVAFISPLSNLSFACALQLTWQRAGAQQEDSLLPPEGAGRHV